MRVTAYHQASPLTEPWLGKREKKEMYMFLATIGLVGRSTLACHYYMYRIYLAIRRVFGPLE